MNITQAKNWFNVYYSQNQEDLILKSFFPHVNDGFYIDVGAHDPEFFSVTKLFYDMGWSGINVEPQKKYYTKLSKARSRDINLNVALGKKKSKQMFREYPDADGLSTLSQIMKKDYEKNKEYKGVTKKYYEYEVPVLTLTEIFEKYCKNKKINFLKLDVEGFEKEVIEGNDWSKYRPQVLCVESNHEIQEWHSVLQAAGYKKFFWDGLNEYFLPEELFSTLSKSFNFPETVLRKIPLANTPLKHFSKEYNSFENDNKTKQKQLDSQDAFIKEQQKAINYLNNKINVLSSLEIESKKPLARVALKIQRLIYKNNERAGKQ